MRDWTAIAIIGVAAVVIGVIVFVFSRNIVPVIVESPADTATTPAVTVPFQELAHGAQSTVTTRANYLINSSIELTQLWKMLEGAGDTPTIDFTKNSVIALFAGKEPTAGYEIRVSQIADARMRMVTITLAKPGGSCLLAQALTTPYQVVVVPKTTLPLTHEDKLKTVSCLE